jgi:hypothetical protein
MALSVGFRITVSLLILLPKLRGSDSYPGGTVSHRTRQPSLDAQWLLPGDHLNWLSDKYWPPAAPRTEGAVELTLSDPNSNLTTVRLKQRIPLYVGSPGDASVSVASIRNQSAAPRISTPAIDKSTAS